MIVSQICKRFRWKKYFYLIITTKITTLLWEKRKTQLGQIQKVQIVQRLSLSVSVSVSLLFLLSLFPPSSHFPHFLPFYVLSLVTHSLSLFFYLHSSLPFIHCIYIYIYIYMYIPTLRFLPLLTFLYRLSLSLCLISLLLLSLPIISLSYFLHLLFSFFTFSLSNQILCVPLSSYLPFFSLSLSSFFHPLSLSLASLSSSLSLSLSLYIYIYIYIYISHFIFFSLIGSFISTFRSSLSSLFPHYLSSPFAYAHPSSISHHFSLSLSLSLALSLFF